MRTLGVDPHKRLLVAVALDTAGQVVDEWQGPNTAAGWQALAQWAAASDPERVWGLEGSGQYGRGLAQQLVAAGETVYEINPRWTAAARHQARQPGKSDRRDALAIARVVRQEAPRLPRVQAADATAVLAVLTSARDDALAAVTRLSNQLHQVLQQLDPGYQECWPHLTTAKALAALQDYAAPDEAPLSLARTTIVRQLAARLVVAKAHAAALGRELAAQARTTCAPLTEIVGVGALTAGLLGGLLGPGARFASDAQLAAYAGVAPLETGSAGVVRHRLNRGGQRQLNALLHRIALTQLRWSSQAQTYVARRQQEGKSWREAVRALKRYIVRAVWRQWQVCLAARKEDAAATP